MDLGLKDKIALVTGASAGIGKGCALSLIKEGANVVICSRNEKNLKKTAEEIKADYFVADISKRKDIDALYNFIVKKYGKIDILINNTGGPPTGSLFDLDDEKWKKNFQNTVMSVVRLTKLVLPGMQEQKFGRIINIQSTSVKQPINNLLLSNSLRPAVLGFSKTVSSEVAKDFVTINTILPGSIETKRQIEFAKEYGEKHGKTAVEMLEVFKKASPIKRMGTPQEIGDIVAFLASKKASFITGAVIQVDGGKIKSVY